MILYIKAFASGPDLLVFINKVPQIIGPKLNVKLGTGSHLKATRVGFESLRRAMQSSMWIYRGDHA